MLSKCYESTEVDRRTVLSGTLGPLAVTLTKLLKFKKDFYLDLVLRRKGSKWPSKTCQHTE